MRQNLPYELVIFGIITAVVSTLIFTLLTGKFIWETKDPYTMLLGSFLLGAILHGGFEYIGFNEKWCRTEFP